ncbi:hypothetical protein [Streptomyces sp. NPDC126499]|uniref:hypothetical protein n=1 Tax=Streptomyces sp. NPDC126499 TaxID=3155314 RepID=UPI003318D85B
MEKDERGAGVPRVLAEDRRVMRDEAHHGLGLTTVVLVARQTTRSERLQQEAGSGSRPPEKPVPPVTGTAYGEHVQQGEGPST